MVRNKDANYHLDPNYVRLIIVIMGEAQPSERENISSRLSHLSAYNETDRENKCGVMGAFTLKKQGC